VTSQDETEVTQTINTEEFEINYTKKRPCLFNFEITIFPEATKKLYAQAIRNVTKEVTLPGFRKGKAPKDFIIKHYQKAIDTEFKRVVGEYGLHQAIRNTQPPFQDRIHELKILSCTVDDGAKLKISYEFSPEIPLINPQAIEIAENQPNPVTEEDIEREFTEIGWNHGDFEAIVDRAIEPDDFIRANMYVSQDKSDWNHVLKSSMRIYLSSNVLPDEIKQRIFGLKIGDEIEGSFQPPNSENSVFYRMDICGIEKGTFPNMDEVAKKLELQDSGELKDKIREKLEQEASMFAYQSNLDQLKGLLFSKFHFDIPSSLLHDKYKEIIAEDKSLQNLDEEKTDLVRRNIYYSLVMEFTLANLISKFIAERNIEVGEEEMLFELKYQLAPPSNYQSEFAFEKDSKSNEQLFHLAKRRKAMETILHEAKKIDVATRAEISSQ